LVPFESLGAVSYSPSIVTMAISVAVCEIFSVKEWCDLENVVRVRSRSLKMAPFDRSHTSSYSPSIVTMAIFFQDGGDRHLENRFFGHNSSTDCLISAKFCLWKQNGMPTKAT